MKKMIRLGLVLGVLTAALTCTALAAGTVYGTGSVSYDSASGKCSITYSQGLEDGNQYALLMVTDRSSINDEGVMYIDQAAASGGKVTFENFIPKVLPEDGQTWTVLLGGKFTDGKSPKEIGTLTYGEGVPLSGKVELQGRSDYSGATITLTDSSGASRTANVAADGSFSIAGVAPGTYTVKITMPGYLPYTINNMEVNGSTVIETKELLAGDINSDASINAADLGLIVSDFGAYEGKPPVNNNCDVNADKSVNAADLSLVISNFGKTAGDLTES